MNGRAIRLVLVATLVAIAGCAGGMGGDPTRNATNGDGGTIDSSDGGVGTAAFYVSDEPNAIDDFEHLNVTITKVGFKKADGSPGADDGNETDDETDGEANESDGDGKDEEGDSDEKDGGDEWVEYDVDERTVDLTELKGANASMIDEFELPAGDYETVFIHVSDTEGVLTDGSTTRVKLPSSKLQVNTEFTIGDTESVDFVYDIAPHKAGKSGKYILEPVISGSGTGDDVEIRDIDTDDEKEDEEDRGNGGGNGGNSAPEANADD